MSELNASNIRKENGNEGPDLVGTTELTSPYYMVPPSGNTEQRPQNPQPGTLRFNTDIGSLEFYRGDTIGWESIDRRTPNLGGAPGPTYAGSNAGTGVRAIVFGGNNGNPYNDIEYFTIPTLGNASDFGNLAATRTAAGSCASRTRGIVAGGQEPGTISAEIDYVTISSTGGSTDFGGDLTDSRDFTAGCSSATRGLFGSGRITAPNTAGDVIDYITIASGGAARDFGNTRSTSLFYPMCLASSTRGIFGSGTGGSSTSQIDFVTIASTGNALEFGTLSTHFGGVGASNSTRGIFAGGYNPGLCNKITYITIATKGNTVTFGDLTSNNRSLGSATSSTRACFIGGKTPSNSNVIQYVEILTTGDATDFGELAQSNSGQKGNVACCSNGHGGL